MNDIFRPGLREDELPDIGLSLLLTSIARQRQEEAGDDDRAASFIHALAVAVRRNKNGEVPGKAGAGPLDAADRTAVSAALVAGLEKARTERNEARRALGFVLGEWQTFVRRAGPHV